MLEDLQRNGHLITIDSEIDPFLEMAEIQRQVYQKNGPALWFRKVKGCNFTCASNIYGSIDRTRFIFRKRLDALKHLMDIKANPSALLRLSQSLKLLGALPSACPRPSLLALGGSVFETEIKLGDLPKIVSWPQDGGPFITLPQVCSVSPLKNTHPFNANLGMYRVQISGNQYLDDEVGIHYQIHRGIGVHHTDALKINKKLAVSIFVGGPPSHALAAVMPLPEGLPELAFAGLLGGRAFRYSKLADALISVDSDFCLVGELENGLKAEGPFGDHLGYYSLRHDFPFMKVNKVFARKDAVWPFTVVGRPPQEDTVFGALIHEITGAVVKTEIPGVSELHAVDASGVHPLLFARGSERYRPYQPSDRPEELLTQALSILGFGQCSLAKYLMITDDQVLHLNDEMNFIQGIISRADWSRDLHFITRTSIDTLDYSGDGFNEGSKVIFAARGPARFKLFYENDVRLDQVGFDPNHTRWIAPGIVAVKMPKFTDFATEETKISNFLNHLLEKNNFDGIRLIVAVDDPDFCARSTQNFIWTTFTRSNPSRDIRGVGEFSESKHWGCHGPLFIDARMKSHHAPILQEDPLILERVNRLKSLEKQLAPYLL